MQGLGRMALFVGVAALVVGVISRLTVVPVYGIKAHAIVQFAEACFLLSIATSVAFAPER